MLAGIIWLSDFGTKAKRRGSPETHSPWRPASWDPGSPAGTAPGSPPHRPPPLPASLAIPGRRLNLWPKLIGTAKNSCVLQSQKKNTNIKQYEIKIIKINQAFLKRSVIDFA